ncbi:MAG: class II aldolase/adducin family protein [Candidatus Aenigmarchaeota archaeon]|nr:class II aldolase/adducin family protein [Candidatus Aenigmarchaeota archaeon]
MARPPEEYAWIRFNPRQLSAKVLSRGAGTDALISVCSDLAAYDLLSSYPAGATYKGNPVQGSNGTVSYSEGPGGPLVLTATPLPSKRNLALADLVRVPVWNKDKGAVGYEGPRPPSSEFWLHEELYADLPVTWIAHVHAPVADLFAPAARRLWRDLGVRETGTYAEDGTLAVPESVKMVLDDPLQDYVVLTGHGTPWDPAHTGAVVMDTDPERLVARIRTIHDSLRAAV